MEQLLGTPPPPPPANVPSLKEDQTTQKLTMRERMEQHRSNPACAACHKVMDPLGFVLGPVVQHEQLELGERLCEHRFDRARQHVGVVPRADHHRCAR